VLSVDQRRDLETTGIARVPGVVSPDEIDAMTDRMWRFFERRGMRRDHPSTWSVGYRGKNQGLRQSGVFNRFANDVTNALLDELLGTGWWAEAEAWGPALVTWPQPGPWQLPHKVWHFDVPGRGNPDRPEVARLFGFISEVGARGGGTLVVEGSHELVRRMVAAAPSQDAGTSSDLRRALNARHPWFAALARAGGDRIRQFMIDGHDIDGIRVRVAELTGAPGDVIVMMPWTMHNLSMNCSERPRFMVTHTVMRHDQRFYDAVPRSAKRGPAPSKS
jgi:hypothetical protein